VKGKKFNMAEAAVYRDAVVFDCQVKAHKIFFEDKLPNGSKPLLKEDWPSSMPKKWKGTVYDITGFYGQQVVALLSLIVNDEDQFKKGKTFYLLIRNSSEDNNEVEYEPLYRLTASPTKHQPGNGIVVLRPKSKVKFTEPAKKYDALNGALKAHYETNTTSFAKDIKKLFKGNTQNKDIPEATIEAYMILLFEIARRLVRLKDPSKEKNAFDVLPIGSAIARLINLLELGISSFEDVFFPNKRFHCFTGKPEVRRKAIEEINEATMNIKHPKATRDTVGLPKEEAEERETNRQLQELQKLFCPDKRSSVEELAQTFKDLTTRLAQEKSGQSSRLLSTSDAESTTAFDHLE